MGSSIGVGTAYNVDAIVEYLAKRHSKSGENHHPSNNLEDLISEARIAAWKAVKSYKQDRDAKMATYITRCVSNRLTDIYRVGNRKPRIDFTDSPPEIESDGFLSVEHDMTMRSLLTAREYVVYRKIFVEGMTVSEISSGPRRMFSAVEARRCLKRILQKYKSQTEEGPRPTLQVRDLVV